jgi:hypothetical protein
MKRHLTYANVMATLGVFLALGGVSYAAIKLPKNSVGAKQIKAGAVGTSEIKNHSIKVGDFKGGLPRGPEGEQGRPGASAEKYWARISGGTAPTVLSSSGNVTVARAANLAAEVTFPADVSNCAIQLTIVGGPSGRTIRVVNQPTGRTVSVWTSFVSGATTTTETLAFNIAAYC